jgi:outer membrane protein assembly factor BamA
MRSTVDIRHFVPRGRGACLAFQAAAMVSHGDVPVYKRLHVGGSQMLRGVPSGWIAGDNACLASTELRFPLLMEREVLGCDFSGTFGVVFCDAAAVWFPREWPDGIRTRLSAGMGLHFLWDGIVLRAECGALSDGRLFFTSSSGVKF